MTTLALKVDASFTLNDTNSGIVAQGITKHYKHVPGIYLLNFGDRRNKKL